MPEQMQTTFQTFNTMTMEIYTSICQRVSGPDGCMFRPGRLYVSGPDGCNWFSGPDIDLPA